MFFYEFTQNDIISTIMKINKNFIIATVIFIFLGLIVVSSFFVDYRDIAQRASAKKQPAPSVASQDNTAKVVNDERILFDAVGDFDVGPRFTSTLLNIKSDNPKYVLALGDLSYGKVPELDWCNQVYQMLGNTPFQLVPGNHDIEPKSQIQKFSRCLPNRINDVVGSYPDRYYFDKDKTIRTIVISPDVQIDSSTNKFAVGSEEYTWLEKILQDAKDKKIRWVVVAMHKNCLTVGDKKCEIGQALSDMLIKNKVDLILQGHQHAYIRSDQLTINDSCKTILPGAINPQSCTVEEPNYNYEKGKGSILAIVGTGGADSHDINKKSGNLNLFNTYFGKNNRPVFGILSVEVSNNKLSARFVENDTGEIKDKFTVEYKDQKL